MIFNNITRNHDAAHFFGLRIFKANISRQISQNVLILSSQCVLKIVNSARSLRLV